MKRAVAYIGVVLVASWIFMAYLFSSPERIRSFGHIMFIPAAVALVMRIMRGESWGELLRPLSCRFNFCAIAFAVLYPLAFIAVCAVIAGVFGWARLDTAKLGELAPTVTAAGLAWAVLKIFGEEYGWRGTLLPELCRICSPFKSAAIVGMVWAIWHGPVLYGLGRFIGIENPLRLCVIQMGAVFVFSFPFAYSYLLSGSIIPPMIFHLIWNLYNPILLGDIYRNTPGIMTGNILLINGEGLLGVILGSIFVAWFARSNHRLEPTGAESEEVPIAPAAQPWR